MMLSIVFGYFNYKIQREIVNCKINSSFISRRIVDNSLTITTAGIEVLLNESGRLRIECVADLYHIRVTKKVVILDEERPILASVLGTRNGSTTIDHMTALPLVLISFLTSLCGR